MLSTNTHHDQSHHKKNKTIIMEYFWNLPQPIIHHILSILSTKEVTRTSILSKSFYSIYHAFPVFNFDQTLIQRKPGNLNKFLDYVVDTINKSRLDVTIPKFTLNVNYHVTSDVNFDARIEFAIDFAFRNGVRDLDFGFLRPDRKTITSYYGFRPPANVCGKSVTCLKLHGMGVNLEGLMSLCPSLENLSLWRCELEKYVKICGGKFKVIDLKRCDGVESVEVKLNCLRSFAFMGENKPCEIDVAECVFLEFLSIRYVNVQDEWFGQHISRLSRIENLLFEGCKELKNVTVCNEKLLRLEVRVCNGLERLEVKVTNLESFVFQEAFNKHCAIDITNCGRIKNLSLNRVKGITDNDLKNMLQVMPDIECLEVQNCKRLRRIEIISEELRRFNLVNWDRLVEFRIEAPKLASFTYQGYMVNCGVLYSLEPLDATLSLRSGFLQTISANGLETWFTMLRNLLSFFGHYKTLTLEFSSLLEVIIPQELRDSLLPPLYDLKYLAVIMDELEEESSVCSDLVDSLLWLAPHPETLQFLSKTKGEKSIKFQYHNVKENKQDDTVSCCFSRPIKCWRHCLKQVCLENFDVADERDRLLTFFNECRCY